MSSRRCVPLLCAAAEAEGDVLSAAAVGVAAEEPVGPVASSSTACVGASTTGTCVALTSSLRTTGIP